MQYNVKAGDTVGIVRMSNYGPVTQGLYVVTNVNKTIVEVTRQSDGYVRTFSNRTGLEKGSDRYRSAVIITKEKLLALEENKLIESEIAQLYQSIARAVQKRNLVEIKLLVERLEGLQLSPNKSIA